MTDLILFLVLALIAIATAMGMLLSKNAVYSALFLVLNFITVAVFYLLLGAPFIAMAQITVYAGAIMVLVVFVIMLLNLEAVLTAVVAWVVFRENADRRIVLGTLAAAGHPGAGSTFIVRLPVRRPPPCGPPCACSCARNRRRRRFAGPAAR